MKEANSKTSRATKKGAVKGRDKKEHKKKPVKKTAKPSPPKDKDPNRDKGGKFIPGIKITVQPIPYQESPVNKIDLAWINDKMLTTGTRLKTIAEETGLNYTYLSSLMNGNEPLAQSMKALFYYYFKCKE